MRSGMTDGDRVTDTCYGHAESIGMYRFKQVKNNKLEWLPVTKKPFTNESEV